MLCQQCQINQTKTTINRFCSRKCYYASRIGVKRPTHGAKVTKALRGTPLSEDRKRDISEAKLIQLAQEDLDQLHHIWSWGYVTHFNAIKYHTNFQFSERVYRRYARNAGYPYEDTITFLPQRLQKLPQSRMLDLLQALKSTKTRRVMKDFQIGAKTARKILDFHQLPWIPLTPGGRGLGQNETKIEFIVREWLEEFGVEYEQEFYLAKRFYDFKVDQTLIEVQGDFWHCNPSVYDEPLHKIQRDNLQNDAYKYQLATQHGYQMVYIWENDIKKEPEVQKGKLRRSICNKAQ